MRTNKDTEFSIREILKSEGYILNNPRQIGELGIDIIATKGKELLYIDVIGYKKSGPARARDFFESFFRIVSRIDNTDKKYIIALPKEWRKGLISRAQKYYRVAWERLAQVFPEISIWLIDIEKKNIEKTKFCFWIDCNI
jgi:hypothetical protein